jgi:hypothetical protein
MNRLPRFDDAAEDRSRISHELSTFFETKPEPNEV